VRTIPALVVRLDPDLGLSRPQGDMDPRCSKCAVAIMPFDAEPLAVLDIDWESGDKSIWIYCAACEPAVRALFGVDD
jgi:hypothetical protein